MKLVNGVGINDANYLVTPTVNGVQVWCPYFRVWKGMMDRAYGNFKNRDTYENVTVADDWHSFMKFREWMLTKDWVGMELDKDLLVEGNDVYSKETCLFVSYDVNLFMTDCRKSRGDLPIGVSFYRRTGKYQATVSGLGIGQKHLGYFNTPDEAHQAYLKAKCDLAIELSKSQNDKVVAEALITRYALRNWHDGRIK